jgi:hypothetical protein
MAGERMSILPQTGNDFAATVLPPTLHRTSYGKTYHFDFATGDFVVVGGKVEQLNFALTFAQAIEKIWRTERYRFLAYDHSYGSSIETLARAGDSDGDLLLVHIANAASDGVRSHPLGVILTNIDITLDDPNNPTTVEISGSAQDTFGATSVLDVTMPVTP